MVVHSPEIVAIRHRRKGAVERQDFETMAWQVEVANDLWPQKGNNVRTDRELESGENLFRDGGGTEHVSALQHQHFFARTSKVRSVREAVVASANHDNVVFV